MAGFVKKVVEKALPIVKNEKSSSMECAVCLQTCVHPAELPCGHIFCYLCIKGIVNQGRRCAMCRRDIPVDYLDKPRLLKPVEAEISNQGFEDGHVWFYEGHNGWWQYDERTSLELEAAYQKGERCCELLIAGFLYVADFDEMLQSRRNDPSRRRRIKRDLATTNKKGVAGLKTTKFSNSTYTNSTAGSSNETTQSWSNSNTTADINPERTFAPAISSDISEPAINNQQSRERTSFELSNSSCSSLPRRHSSPSADNTTRLSRNFNFDNVVHETLDWTLEQIESLNLELLNDYEALFRDANSYGRSQDSSNRTRSHGVVGNYLSQYLNRTSRDSPEDDAEAAYRALDLSGLSIRDTDPLTVSTNERQSASVTQSIESSSADARPIGETRRRNFLRRSTSLNHEIGESKFS